MPSIKKSRPHRSLSSYLNTFNKENHLDFGNRIVQIPKKISSKLIPDEPHYYHPEIRQSKVLLPKQLPPIMIQSSKLTQMSTSQMFKMEENIMLSKNYGCDIMDTLIENDQKSRLSNILFTHNIPKDLRCRMIDWMIEVIGAFKFSEESFFTTVRLMDTFFMKTSKSHQPQQVHLTGVTCMYIATKFQQVHPLKLKTVFQKIGHRKLPAQSILKKQSQILNALDFALTGVNHYEILNQITYMTELETKLGKKHFTYLNKVCLYLSKMVLFEVEIMTNYDYSTIACANLYVGFKIIEQVYQGIHPDIEIKDSLHCVDVPQSRMMEAASKILALAKSFDKVYHNLQNLRKFNGFADSYEKAQKPVTTR